MCAYSLYNLIYLIYIYLICATQLYHRFEELHKDADIFNWMICVFLTKKYEGWFFCPSSDLPETRDSVSQEVNFANYQNYKKKFNSLNPKLKNNTKSQLPREGCGGCALILDYCCISDFYKLLKLKERVFTICLSKVDHFL